MPLHTQIRRNGELRNDIRWGGFHVAAMVYAASIDSGQGPFTNHAEVEAQMRTMMEEEGFIPITMRDAFDLMNYWVLAATPLNAGEYTLKERWAFKDVQDGEEFVLEPGDTLIAFRN